MILSRTRAVNVAFMYHIFFTLLYTYVHVVMNVFSLDVRISNIAIAATMAMVELAMFKWFLFKFYKMDLSPQNFASNKF